MPKSGMCKRYPHIPPEYILKVFTFIGFIYLQYN